MRGMHNNLVVKVHYRPLQQDLIANTRGVHREVESGGSWTHISQSDDHKSYPRHHTLDELAEQGEGQYNTGR